MTEPSFLKMAFRRDVRKRAMRIALIVGPIIAFINHGDKMVTQSMDAVMWLKVFLTFIVPYAVSTWSSVMALRQAQSNC